MKAISLALLVISSTLYGGKPAPSLRTKLGHDLRSSTKNIDYCNWTAGESDSDEEYEEQSIPTYQKTKSKIKKRKPIQLPKSTIDAVFNSPTHNYVVKCSRCSSRLQYGIYSILKYNAKRSKVTKRSKCKNGRKKHVFEPIYSPQKYRVCCIKPYCGSVFSGSLKEIKDRLYNHIVIKTRHPYSADKLNDELKLHILDQLQNEFRNELEAPKSVLSDEEEEKVEEWEMNNNSLALYSELEERELDPLFGMQNNDEIWPNK